MSVPRSTRSQIQADVNRLEGEYRRGRNRMLVRQAVCVLGSTLAGSLYYFHTHAHSPGNDVKIALAMGGLPGALVGAVIALAVSYSWPGRWGFRAQSDRVNAINHLRRII